MTAYERGYAEAYSTLPDELHGDGWWKRYEAGRAARYEHDTGCERAKRVA
jgi:hypothetical protein